MDCRNVKPLVTVFKENPPHKPKNPREKVVEEKKQNQYSKQSLSVSAQSPSSHGDLFIV